MFRRRILRALGKQLTVITASYSGVRPPDCAVITRPIFRALAPYIHDHMQLLFVRDNPVGAAGQRIGGGTYFRDESLIGVPAWPVDRAELTAVIAHELHHLARWQNASYGETLGGALLSEGYASWFEILMSGWKPAWTERDIPRAAILAAKKEWGSSYDHHAWFYDGVFGKSTGYALGYKLVMRTLLGTFDLETSLTEQPTDRYLKALTGMLRKE